MLNDANTPNSPGWWLLRLGTTLAADTDRLETLQQYDSGKHPLPTGNRKMRETYHRLQKMSRSNYTGLIAEAVRERLSVLGFRTGSAGSQSTDEEAWRIWQANSLDADCGIVHHQAGALGRAYVIVGPNPQDPTTPIITPESPLSVIHESDPIRSRVLLAAMKTWLDSISGRQLAIVYLPDRICYFRAVKEGQSGTAWQATAWEPDPDKSEAPNPLGEVPVIPFVNRRQRNLMGMGEFEDVTDIQDRINVTVLDRLVTQAMQAYRQRWIKGVEVEDENGNPQRPFDPGADLLWIVPDADASFGDFQATDLKPILSACSADIRDIAAISRTPPHYLLADIANVSGDALAAAESGLTSKVKDRAIEFGECWERVIRLAGQYIGSEIGTDSVIVWADPERHTLAELADAAVKWEAAGVPFRERMALLGFTPSEIDRMEAERMKDALMASLSSPMGVDPGAAPAATTLPLTDPGASAPQTPPAPPAVK
ncbi:phage portal protein [Kitasatospora acidiphila]|uniref:Phage portal protein n=1 Tax=Kitasatospora acidiphila TaxID=2567942 RepID=A0A540W4N3_9ACTN|nr:phage portal protein [Kitasatospora acidiphila]TQF03923.1 phage portal protein [Kitasatospora acidiphila]